MIETKDGLLYPIWIARGFKQSDPETYFIAESEMIGNILHQLGKAMSNDDFDVITIGKKEGEYVDARIPRI